MGKWLLGAALGALVIAAAPARAQTLQIAVDQSPVGLDPHIATAFSSTLITSAIYEGLTAIDAELHVVPALAESWTVSADGKTYLFKLRAGARFHDGSPVTPADVIASLARVRDVKTGSPYASRFAGVVSLEGVGSDGVRIVLNAPSAPFLAQLASVAIIPAAALGGGADLARHPDGTGPFKFREWVPNTLIALDRNENYWANGLPKLAGLRFNIVPEAATRQLGLTGGTYQLLPNIDAATAAQLANTPGVKVQSTDDLAYSLIGLNAAKPPFDKAEVREALEYAINRPQLVQAAYLGKAVPAGPLSPALKDWALPVSAFPCYTPNLERAKALLRQAGITLPLKVTMNVLGSVQQVVDVAQVVQAQAKAAGIEFTLNVQEAGRFIQDWRAGNFEAFASLNSGGVDPDDYFGRTFQTGGATNVFKYSNPKLDALLTEARQTMDQAKRKTLYDEAQKILACTGPVVHLAYGTLFSAQRDALQGFTLNPTRSLRGLREAALAP
ncbi:MAG TPA: ABC transporter substrate-binding protein [Acetobacteraceae bacterium]|nr:ABC transporter substrate-binding protein [Acetobacteraceae bacterium]